MSSLDESLRKLRVDHIDLWQLHMWDDTVALEDVLQLAVASGRTRGHRRLQRALKFAGVAFVQMEYSLLERGVERELLPCAADYDITILPWARWLFLEGVPEKRQNSRFLYYVNSYVADPGRRAVVQKVADHAAELGCHTGIGRLELAQGPAAGRRPSSAPGQPSSWRNL